MGIRSVCLLRFRVTRSLLREQSLHEIRVSHMSKGIFRSSGLLGSMGAYYNKIFCVWGSMGAYYNKSFYAWVFFLFVRI